MTGKEKGTPSDNLDRRGRGKEKTIGKLSPKLRPLYHKYLTADQSLKKCVSDYLATPIISQREMERANRRWKVAENCFDKINSIFWKAIIEEFKEKIPKNCRVAMGHKHQVIIIKKICS